MKLKHINIKSVALLSTVSLIAVSNAQTTFTFINPGGNLETPAFWQNETDGTTGALPQSGDIAIINVDSLINETGALGLQTGGNLIFGGGSEIDAVVDFVAARPDSVTFNDVTVIADDDIFTGAVTGNYFFNAGSVTQVDDDFEANAGGTITINGGTHMVGLMSPNVGNFGAQNNSTLNFLGGTVTTDVFRTDGANATVNLGGDATITADTISLAPNGILNISSDWTGSITTNTPTNFEDLFVDLVFLDDVLIDEATFNENFQIIDGVFSSIPEPSAAMLGGLGLLGLLRRRRM